MSILVVGGRPAGLFAYLLKASRNRVGTALVQSRSMSSTGKAGNP